MSYLNACCISHTHTHTHTHTHSHTLTHTSHSHSITHIYTLASKTVKTVHSIVTKKKKEKRKKERKKERKKRKGHGCNKIMKAECRQGLRWILLVDCLLNFNVAAVHTWSPDSAILHQDNTDVRHEATKPGMCMSAHNKDIHTDYIWQKQSRLYFRNVFFSGIDILSVYNWQSRRAAEKQQSNNIGGNAPTRKEYNKRTKHVMIKVTGSDLTTTTPPSPYHIFNISYEFLPLSEDVTPVTGSLYTTSGVPQSFSPFRHCGYYIYQLFWHPKALHFAPRLCL